MKLNHLSLYNFRNYDQLDLDLDPNLNIFLGQNAQGKTNILEAIYFLAMTRSHRTHHDRDLIQWDKTDMKVSGQIQKEISSLLLEVQLNAKGRHASVNHLPENRLADYIGRLNVILFAPEDLGLIKGAPSGRRRFLDMEIGQVRPLYLYESLHYNRVLKERNAYLKFDKDKIDLNFLDVLDSQLVTSGVKIIKDRLDFVDLLSTQAGSIHSQLTQEKEKLVISYSSTSQNNFLDQLGERRQIDISRHQTSLGPHRDDLVFTINGVNIANFGSQGQQRTVALSIKLAEIDLIFQETGQYPILLLDDVMSELDNDRQLDLLGAALGKTQTFLTTTTLDHLHQLPTHLTIFQIVEGAIATQTKT